MPDKTSDVNKNVPGASSDPSKGVTSGSPPANNKHEETVPYDRFKTVADKASKVDGLEDELKTLKSELEALKKTSPESDASFNWDTWDSDPLPPANASPPRNEPAQRTPAQPPSPMDWDMANKEFREGMDGERPLDTFINWYQKVKNYERNLEADAKKIPGYKDVRDDAEMIPDEVVQRIMSNPTAVRVLLAKQKKRSDTTSTPTSLPNPATTTTELPKSMEELRAQIAKEEAAKAEKALFERLGIASGLFSEGSRGSGHSDPNSPADKIELDEAQLKQFSKFGFNVNDPAVREKLTKRLEKTVRSDNTYESFMGGLE